MGFFSFFSKEKKETLDKGLSKTKEGVFAKLARVVAGKSTIDDDVLDDLEEVFVTSDVGVKTTVKILDRIQARVKKDKYVNTAELNDLLCDEITQMLVDNNNAGMEDFTVAEDKKPYVIMVVGVNGVGKTTTIGKLAYQFKKAGNKVVLGAADTFRAAAIDQLQIWADRADVDIVKHKEGADPAAVVYDTIEAGKDIELTATDGNLYNNTQLISESGDITLTAKNGTVVNLLNGDIFALGGDVSMVSGASKTDADGKLKPNANTIYTVDSGYTYKDEEGVVHHSSTTGQTSTLLDKLPPDTQIAWPSDIDDRIVTVDKYYIDDETGQATLIDQSVVVNNLTDAEKKAIRLDELKTARQMAVSDYGTNTIGVQFANGVSAILAYDPNCAATPYNSSFAVMGCVSLIYDTNGTGRPNQLSKDMNTINTSNNLGVIATINGVKVTGIAKAGTYATVDCTNTSGPDYKYCEGSTSYDNDYWAGAAKYCGGKSNMASEEDLQKIASFLYSPTFITTNDKVEGLVVNNDNLTKLNSYGFPNPSFSVWSSNVSSAGASFRHFSSTSTRRSNGYRDGRGLSGLMAVCTKQ